MKNKNKTKRYFDILEQSNFIFKKLMMIRY